MGETLVAGQRPRLSIATALFDPFYYLAGGRAAGLGLVFILLTGVIGYFGHSHVDGVLDLHTGRPAPLWLFLAEGPIDWLALAVPLYLAGRLLSRSRAMRAIDVFGTQALARAPYLLLAAASLLPGFQRTVVRSVEIARRIAAQNGAALDASQLTGNPIDFIVYLGVIILGLLTLVWMIALMYRAYASACNLNGARAIVSFIVAVIVGELISKVALSPLLALGLANFGH